jgi:hypothetical protein
MREKRPSRRFCVHTKTTESFFTSLVNCGSFFVFPPFLGCCLPLPSFALFT